MGEPMKVRTKSIADIRNQANRIQQEIINRIGTTTASNQGISRYRRTEEIAQRYINNAMDSPTMRRVYRGEGARDIQVPRSQYMRNNRRG